MKVERVILEGLRRAGAADEGHRFINPAHEQQAEEALLRARRRTNNSVSSTEEEGVEILAPSPRRPSTILQELSRQASVLWNSDAVSEGEEDDGGSTTDDEGLRTQAKAYDQSMK